MLSVPEKGNKNHMKVNGQGWMCFYLGHKGQKTFRFHTKFRNVWKWFLKRLTCNSLLSRKANKIRSWRRRGVRWHKQSKLLLLPPRFSKKKMLFFLVFKFYWKTLGCLCTCIFSVVRLTVINVCKQWRS